jgi:hypothetical protein
MPELEQIEGFGKPRPGSGLAIQAGQRAGSTAFNPFDFTESDKLIL